MCFVLQKPKPACLSQSCVAFLIISKQGETQLILLKEKIHSTQKYLVLKFSQNSYPFQPNFQRSLQTNIIALFETNISLIIIGVYIGRYCHSD